MKQLYWWLWPSSSSPNGNMENTPDVTATLHGMNTAERENQQFFCTTF